MIQIEGNFDQALSIVKDVCVEEQFELVNSLNPFRLEGQKDRGDGSLRSVGSLALVSLFARGERRKYFRLLEGIQGIPCGRQITQLPKMMGVQAEGAAPIVRGHVIDHPQTMATAIRIGNPASWKLALQAVQESSGTVEMVTDEEILAAYQALAKEEGVFCEPASAASVAGLTKDSQAGRLPEGATVVCTLTGHGLKDPDIAVNISPKTRTVKASRDAVFSLLQI